MASDAVDVDEHASTDSPRKLFMNFDGNLNSSDPSNSADSSVSLQDAFQRFRKQRKRDLRRLTGGGEAARDAEWKARLRLKFFEQAKRYMGVPYARKYHQPGTPEYDAPLFLDCCGLVRQVMRDLEGEFGFRIGPWNQAYMYDTLPVTVEQEQMQPGDLVFVEGVFFDPAVRRQKHDITHIEIWLGDGEKTLGARWRRGLVQVFDSYRFDSQSYEIKRFVFKSIEPWLNGQCVSHCSEHNWKPPTMLPLSPYSVFYDSEDEHASQDGDLHPD